MKHEPDPEDPRRCRATDLLVTDCSGCRGSDESFADLLLASEREWTVLVPDSHPFESIYSGSQCKARCGQEIKTGQLIVHLTVGGYAHVACLKENS